MTSSFSVYRAGVKRNRFNDEKSKRLSAASVQPKNNDVDPAFCAEMFRKESMPAA
jgi:hypothetical protein